MRRRVGIFAKAKFYLGNIKRYLNKPWSEYEVDLKDCRTIFASSFTNDGWHHVIQTLQEYDENSDISYQETTLYRFLKYFTPNSICDLIDCDQNCSLPLFSYPWGAFHKKKSSSDKKDVLASRFCGPSSDEFISEVYQRIISLYDIVKKEGYQPWKYSHSFIEGVWLIKNKKEKRFVVLQGNHRLAILAHLGYSHLKVRLLQGSVKKVELKNLCYWPNVVNGLCQPEVAKNIFNLFFDENGCHIEKIIHPVCRFF